MCTISSNFTHISVIHQRSALQDHAQSHSQCYPFIGAFVLSHISSTFLYSCAQQLIRFHSISIMPPIMPLYFPSSMISICRALNRFPTIAFNAPHSCLSISSKNPFTQFLCYFRGPNPAGTSHGLIISRFMI